MNPTKTLQVIDLPANITAQQVREVAQAQYRILLQNDEEELLLQQRDMDGLVDAQTYNARLKEIEGTRQALLNLLDELKSLHEEVSK